MAIETTIKHNGAKATSTLSGDIRLEEAKGRLVIYDPTNGNELVNINRTGFLFADSDERRIKIGAAPDDGRVGFWQTPNGKDVITKLGG